MKFFLFFLLCLQSEAAYRVYKHKVEHYDEKGKKIRTETVLSTLDHVQYEYYHSGYKWMRVQLENTWYCPGDTSGYRSYCPEPKVKNPGQGPIPYNRQPIRQ
jgi:hypothetical protein